MQFKFSYIVSTLVLLLCEINAARILGLFSHTGKSHFTVFEPLLRELAERGHYVTVVSFFPAKNPPANYTSVSLEGIAPLGIEVIDMNYLEETNLLFKSLGLGRRLTCVLSFHPLADMALDVCEKLVKWKPLEVVLHKRYDAIIVENFNSDCMLGLAYVYGLQVPVITLVSTGMFPWSAERIGVSDNPAYVPMLSTDFADRMTFLERLENTFYLLYLKIWYRYAIQTKEQKMIEDHFGKPIPDLNDLAKNTSLMLVNTYHSFYGVRPLVPGLVEVAGMHLDPTRKAIPCYMERFLEDSEEGVVLFSFGSLIKMSTIPEHKEDIIVSVLSKLKQRVIWKYEGSDEEGTLNGNILKVNWMPQYELMQHKKVVAVIAHGGISGTIEAIAAGKPMVLMPFYGDQPLNAAAAESVGVARVLSYSDLSEESFSEAIQAVLRAETRLNSRRMAKIWTDRPLQPLDAAVYWTERVIRWGFREKLHSPKRDLSFLEYTLLDIFATFILGLILIASILIFVFLIIINCIKSVFTKNKAKVH